MSHRIEIAMAMAALMAAGAACGHGDPTFVPASGSGSDGSGNGRIAEPGRDDEGPRLELVITKTYAHQQPSAAAPYHVDGGTWTYADAHIAGDDAATFGFGIPAFDGDSDASMFGKMMLVPTTPEAGARVAAAFARAFLVTAPPPPPVPPGPLAPVRIPVAVLGHDVARGAGFAGRGTWDALKWFCPVPGDEPPEVFFNVDLADQRGEWTEKDADYDAAVAGFLASALRDGPPPPRTPQNDPTFAAVGPRVVLGRKIRDTAVTVVKLTATRGVLTERSADQHHHVLALDPRTGAVTTLYDDPIDDIDDGSCDDSALHCAFALHELHDNQYDGDAPGRTLLVDGSDVRIVPELAGTAIPTSAAVSPGGEWVVLGEHNTLTAWSRATGQTVAVHTPDHTSAYVWGWRRDGRSWTALVTAIPLASDDDPHLGFRWSMARPATLVPSADAPDPSAPPATSPDGSRTAVFGDGKLVVTPRVGAPRTLVLQPADADALTHYCTWLDNRYLVVPDAPLRFIDTDAMKVSLMPALAGVDAEAHIEVTTGVGLAIVVDDHASYLSTIETRSSP